jgi:predicted GH43/DUF377 family glycosyl hydrolase
VKFTWSKKSIIFNASQLNLSWATNSALTPTPFIISKDVIRVYAGFRDDSGVSRIGYVDLNMHYPLEVLGISQQPCLDIGSDGCFDDNGVIPGDIIRVNNEIWMYYVGFQLVKKVKFLAFSGLAKSVDGEVFTRVSKVPVLDRRENATMINAIHTVLNDGSTNTYRVWHASGDGWEYVNNKPFPQYNIWTSSSADGVMINPDAQLCIDNSGDEYRIGRPSVYKIKNKFIMFYTWGTKAGTDYFPGLALSDNGIDWTRRDELFGIQLSDFGWDSRHIAYPRLLQISDNQYYVFYNGNNMGQDGFGYALLTIED